MLDSEAARNALNTGSHTEDVPGWKRITTHRDLYESFRGIDLDAALAKYPGSLLSIRGTLDFLPAYEPQFLKLARGRPAEALSIAGADHIFNAFDQKSTAAEEALSHTIGWCVRMLQPRGDGP